MNLQEILNIKYPLIQGAMANITTGKFAADVSNAGGLGIIATGGMDVDALYENIRICKENTDKPFGVNIIMMHRDIDKIAELVVREKVPVVTTGAGNPEKYVKYWKENNIKIFPVISSIALAKKMESLGVDGLIAEGSEAGGHIGEPTTMVLTPQVVSSVNLPVVCAGGVATGRQILAAEVLGACGVQMGTVMLATEECPIHDNYKEKILKAKTSQVTVIGRINGLPTRLIKNPMSSEYIKKEKEGASIEELELFTFGALRKSAINGDIKNGSIMSGQVVGEVNEIKKIEDLFKDLYSDYLEEREKICKSL